MNHRLEEGTPAPAISLPAIDGTAFQLSMMHGKPFMLSFFRFATCPFCNLRVHELVKRHYELGDGFGIVAVFDSPLDHLQKHAAGHHASFPILADPENRYYQVYGIEHSMGGVLKGMVTRMPTLIKGMAKGYVPTSIKGSITTMPADFLIDEAGVIQIAHYGRDEGDHLPFAQVKSFALGRKRNSFYERSVAG